ncbi:hypothetical protein GGX14DRAFT_369013 [Mycena pura]|uniref:CCHC-type domain-containing protein n=1 Tax=Mycena pura TaxID=153505 RepID=A0AAD6Y6K3_9AGAR|nr:hypothetical protein GGX14DRAFT_369013 [Mycena pura]
MERNVKRDERRKGGEEGVSDDEPDELTPYIVVIPSGEGSTSTKNQSRSGAVQPTEDSKLLFDDTVAEKNAFRAHDNTIPTAIYSLAKNGISPPLTLFLPESLERIRSSNVKTVKHGTGESTKVTVIDLSDFPDEDSLDLGTWCTCYNTSLTFIQTASGLRIFQGFAQHYNQMLADPGLGVWFRAYCYFDKRIRAQFFTKPYIVDIQDDEYRSALQSAKNTFLMSNQPTSSATPSSNRGNSGSGSHKDKVERTRPYDHESSSRRKEILCFRCGRTGHGAGSCKEVNPSRHGREFVISANRDGLFRISDSRAVCMGFNCGKCDASGRNHAVHICSLCGDAHHGAVSCTRN